MNLVSLTASARRRVRAVRNGTAASDIDSGFMLIYVLMITTIVTILVGSTLVVTAANIVPAVRSAYNEAADAAAQGGLQDFVAYIDANCGAASASVSTCTLPSNYQASKAIPMADSTNGSYTASYAWQAQKDPGNRYFRVRSTGTVKQGGLTSSKTLVGDVIPGSSSNTYNYGVVTGFESESSNAVLAQWPQRTIALDAGAVSAASVPVKGNSITWSGASPGTAAGKVAVCNATFDVKGGRSTNLPPFAPNPYVDWTESGTAGNNYTNFQPCQTSWGTQTKLLAAANPADGAGGYFSNDAMLLSNSYPGGTGPLFDQPVTTNWKYTSADAGICSTVQGQNYRSFNLLCAGYPVEVGGTPSPSSTYPNVLWSRGPSIQTASPVIPASACVYTGPTRVQLAGDTAVITSPQTTSAWVSANAATRPAQCYTGAGALGLAASTISLSTPTVIRVISVSNDGSVPSTTPAQAHGSSGWPVTGQTLGATPSTTAGSSNSVFYLTSGTAGTTSSTTNTVTATDAGYTPVTSDNPSTKADGAWTPQWTSDTASSCAAPPANADLGFFNCSVPSATYSPTYSNAYSWVKAGVQAAIAANPQNYTTASQLTALVNSFTSQGNSSDANNSAPSNIGAASHRFVVSVAQRNAGTCTQSSNVPGTASDTPISAPSSDPFYASTTGNAHAAPATTTSCFTATVTQQIGTCNIALAGGVCVSLVNYVWGNGAALVGSGLSTPQFTTTFTVKATTTTTTVTPAVSSFPSMSDVTQYNLGGTSKNPSTFGTSGPGDLYIDGTTNHTLAVVAANDLVVTGNTGAATGQALQAVGRNDVRIYHPVSCKITDPTLIANTSPGFCPDDITGLYSGLLPAGANPYEQYVNLRPDLANLTITATTLFALGNSDGSITCPQPPNGGGVCGGDFTADNYNRGAPLGTLKEIGTLAMAHHAPVGEEWQIPDTRGQTGRTYSGYQLTQQYQNLDAAIKAVNDVSGVLTGTNSVSALLWHITSVSSGS